MVLISSVRRFENPVASAQQLRKDTSNKWEILKTHCSEIFQSILPSTRISISLCNMSSLHKRMTPPVHLTSFQLKIPGPLSNSAAACDRGSECCRTIPALQRRINYQDSRRRSQDLWMAIPYIRNKWDCGSGQEPCMHGPSQFPQRDSNIEIEFKFKFKLHPCWDWEPAERRGSLTWTWGRGCLMACACSCCLIRVVCLVLAGSGLGLMAPNPNYRPPSPAK